MNAMPCVKELREDDNFALLVRQIREGLKRLLEHELSGVGVELNHSQCITLKLLAKYGPQSPGDLARQIDLDAGAMTRLLDRLESKGYLHRQPNAEDRRALTVEMTEAGQAMRKTIQRCTDQMQTIALRNLKDAERKQLLSLLVRVRDTLEKNS